jgi:two-component system cell cycle sensor histidine kinase/response regulator CckA
MKDDRKTKEQLIEELSAFRQQNEELKKTITLFGFSEDVLSVIGNSIQAGIYIIQEGKTIYVNSHISAYSGYTREELMRLSLMKDTVHPEDQTGVRACGIKMLKGQDLTPYEYRIITKDGSVKWLMEKVTTIQYRGRISVLGNTMDITEKKRIEEELQKLMTDLELRVQERTKELSLATDALQESEEFLNGIVENIPDMIFVKDAEKLQFVRFNKAGEELLGYTREELIGKNDYDFFPSNEADFFTAKDREVLHEKQQIDIPEETIQTKYLGERILHTKKIVILNKKGNPQYLLGISEDITKRKQAEETLKLDESRLETLLTLNAMEDKSVNDIIDYALEEMIRLTKSNAGYLAFTNEDETVLTMHSWSKRAMEKCSLRYNTMICPMENTGLWTEPVRQRKPIITNDYNEPNPLKKGYPRHHFKLIRHVGVPIMEGNHVVMTAGMGNKSQDYDDSDVRQITLMIGGLWKIIQRRRAEEELRESRRSLFGIIDFLPDATLVIDKEGKVIAWNRAIEAMTGIKAEEMLGKSNYEYALPFYGVRRPILIDLALDPNQKMEKRYTTIQRQGDILIGESYTPSLRKDAGVQISATASVLHDSKGEVIGAIECIRDITERKRIEEERQRLEERLHRAEKMEALGTLAGGVAHDLNNVLGVLVGYSELLLEKIPEGNQLRKYVSNILQSSERGAAIIQDLLTLARRGVAVSEVISLNTVVSDYFRTLEFEKLKTYHPHVTFKIEVDKDLMNIKGSPVHLSKTIMNLVSNASEAISDQGEVTILTENRYLDKPVWGYDDMREGDYVVLTISDNGKGISNEDIGKIFEPFYTKKVMGRSGTGLGLAVVWGTVKDHHGYIDVQSEEGKGSTFMLYFPVTRDEIVKDQKVVSRELYTGRGESILVVDDVHEQRELATTMLKGLGYQVDTVASGEDAVLYLKTNRVDLMILDMIMDPGIDGLETYRRVLEINPKQKAIIVSGFSETDRVKKAQELGAGAYVRKPYILAKIGLAIKGELDRKVS